MKLCLKKARLPEEIRKCTPFLIGCRGDKFAFLFDADIDGCQDISRKEAEKIVENFTGYDINSFIKIAQYQDLFVKV